MVAEDLEFYHDQTGLAVGRQPFVDAIKANICGKVHRELVAGTIEVLSAQRLRRGRDRRASLYTPQRPAFPGRGEIHHAVAVERWPWKVTRVSVSIITR